MDSQLLTLAQVAPLLGCRDRRTARCRLVALGCPAVRFGRRVYVDPAELSRAIQRASRQLDPDAAPAIGAGAAGVTVAPGTRLWDGLADG